VPGHTITTCQYRPRQHRVHGPPLFRVDVIFMETFNVNVNIFWLDNAPNARDPIEKLVKH